MILPETPVFAVVSGLFLPSDNSPDNPDNLRVIFSPRAAVAGSLAPDAENPVFPMPPAVCDTEITPVTPAVKRCRCEALCIQKAAR